MPRDVLNVLVKEIYIFVLTLYKEICQTCCADGVREHNFPVFNTLGEGSTGMKIAVPKLWQHLPRPGRRTNMRIST